MAAGNRTPELLGAAARPGCVSHHPRRTADRPRPRPSAAICADGRAGHGQRPRKGREPSIGQSKNTSSAPRPTAAAPAVLAQIHCLRSHKAGKTCRPTCSSKDLNACVRTTCQASAPSARACCAPSSGHHPSRTAAEPAHTGRRYDGPGRSPTPHAVVPGTGLWSGPISPPGTPATTHHRSTPAPDPPVRVRPRHRRYRAGGARLRSRRRCRGRRAPARYSIRRLLSAGSGPFRTER